MHNAILSYPNKSERSKRRPFFVPIPKLLQIGFIRHVRDPETRHVLSVLGSNPLLEEILAVARRPAGSPFAPKRCELAIVAVYVASIVRIKLKLGVVVF